MSKPKVANWVAENTASVGTGDIVLAGALEGFARFSVIGDGDVYYTLQNGMNKECGIGTLSGATIKRKTILASLIDGKYASPGEKINLDGYAEIYCTVNASIFTEIILALDKVSGIEDGADANPALASLVEATAGTEDGIRSWSPSRIWIAVQGYLKSIDFDSIAGFDDALATSSGASMIGTTGGKTVQESLDALNRIFTLLSDATAKVHKPYVVSNFNITARSVTLNIPSDNYSTTEPIVIVTVLGAPTNVTMTYGHESVDTLGEVYTSVTLTFPDDSYIGKRCNAWLVGG